MESCCKWCPCRTEPWGCVGGGCPAGWLASLARLPAANQHASSGIALALAVPGPGPAPGPPASQLFQFLTALPPPLQRQLGNVNFELRDIVSKAKHPAKFRPYDMVEHVRLEGRKFQCLYTEGEPGRAVRCGAVRCGAVRCAVCVCACVCGEAAPHCTAQAAPAYIPPCTPQ